MTRWYIRINNDPFAYFKLDLFLTGGSSFTPFIWEAYAFDSLERAKEYRDAFRRNLHKSIWKHAVIVRVCKAQ